MKRFFNVIGLVCACAMTQAQPLLPPVWQADTKGDMQISSRTIAYLPATRIVWQETTGDSSIKGLENLLLKGNGQADLFDGQIVSCEVGCGKPHREIYDCLLTQYELNPAETIFIDDRIDNVEAAANMGITPFHFDRKNPKEACQALRRVIYNE